MNAVMENILTRRSVRKFTEKPVPAEILKELVDAALHAPSGCGKQTWQFTVVTNRSEIGRLADVVGKVLKREGYDMYRPTVLIIPSNLRDSIWGKEDNACAMENIFLAAHSLGVGSVWINQLQEICGNPEVRAVLSGFGIPEDHVVYGLAALGYPAPDAPVKEMKRIGKVVYCE